MAGPEIFLTGVGRSYSEGKAQGRPQMRGRMAVLNVDPGRVADGEHDRVTEAQTGCWQAWAERHTEKAKIQPCSCDGGCHSLLFVPTNASEVLSGAFTMLAPWPRLTLARPENSHLLCYRDILFLSRSQNCFVIILFLSQNGLWSLSNCNSLSPSQSSSSESAGITESRFGGETWESGVTYLLS